MKTKNIPANLTLLPHKNNFLSMVENNPVSVLVAGTGAGKSTLGMLWLVEAGYSVISTQPLRMTVEQLPNILNGWSKSNKFDYKHGNKKYVNPDAEGIYMTDGLAIINQFLNGLKTDVLIVDEVHEWNKNQVVLLGWIKKLAQEGKLPFKVVLLSATINIDNLATYLELPSTAVMEVEGRNFPVIEKEINKRDAIKFAMENSLSTLVFLPGKKEIEDFQETIKYENSECEIYHIHSSIDDDMKLKLKNSNKLKGPKFYLATNAVQTGYNFPWDYVIDTGEEKRAVYEHGMEKLKLMPISEFSRIQIKGRVGRMKEGFYSYIGPEIKEQSTPTEISRMPLEKLILLTAAAGLKLNELDIIDKPKLETMEEAMDALLFMGAITNDGIITKYGRKLLRYPMDPKTASVLIRAEEYNMVAEAIIIAAIDEEGGITHNKNNGWTNHIDAYIKDKSTLLAQAELFRLLDNGSIHGTSLRDLGVITPKLKRVRKNIKDMRKSLKVRTEPRTMTHENFLEIFSSKYSIFVKYGYEYTDNRINTRISDSNTCVEKPVLFGTPFGVPTRRGTLNLLTLATTVPLEFLVKQNYSFVELRDIKNEYREDTDSIVKLQEVIVHGVNAGTYEEEIHDDDLLKTLRKEYMLKKHVNNTKARVVIIGSLDNLTDKYLNIIHEEETEWGVVYKTMSYYSNTSLRYGTYLTRAKAESAAGELQDKVMNHRAVKKALDLLPDLEDLSSERKKVNLSTVEIVDSKLRFSGKRYPLEDIDYLLSTLKNELENATKLAKLNNQLEELGLSTYKLDSDGEIYLLRYRKISDMETIELVESKIREHLDREDSAVIYRVNERNRTLESKTITYKIMDGVTVPEGWNLNKKEVDDNYRIFIKNTEVEEELRRKEEEKKTIKALLGTLPSAHIDGYPYITVDYKIYGKPVSSINGIEVHGTKKTIGSKHLNVGVLDNKVIEFVSDIKYNKFKNVAPSLGGLMDAWDDRF